MKSVQSMQVFILLWNITFNLDQFGCKPWLLTLVAIYLEIGIMPEFVSKLSCATMWSNFATWLKS